MASTCWCVSRSPIAQHNNVPKSRLGLESKAIVWYLPGQTADKYSRFRSDSVFVVEYSEESFSNDEIQRLPLRNKDDEEEESERGVEDREEFNKER